MIIDVKKYLFIGAAEDLDYFFSKAQEKGFIEFVPSFGKRHVELPIEIMNLIMAIKILRKQPLKMAYKGGELSLAIEVSKKILSLKTQIDKLEEEKRLLELEISRVAPFGAFSTEDLHYLEKNGKLKVQFFCMKAAKRHEIDFSDEIIYIGTEYDLDYLITISHLGIRHPEMIEMKIEFSASELKDRLVVLEGTLHDSKAQLKDFAGYIDFLQEAYLELIDQHQLFFAKKMVEYPLETALFAIEAWIPENKSTSLYLLLEGMAVHCEQIAVEKEDRIPTYLKNKGLNRIGEDLVSIYDIPGTTDKDPSAWILWAFLLFFAMIVADAGYGLLFLATTLYLKYKFPKLKGQSKRLLTLFGLLAGSCILWGILTGCYFGLNLTPDHPLSRLSLVNYLAERKADYHMQMQDDVYKSWVQEIPVLSSVTTGRDFLLQGVIKKGGKISYKVLAAFRDNIFLEFSLLVGVIHISLSFLRYLFRHIAGLGWIAFMIGSYLFFPRLLKATSLVHFLGIVGKEEGSAVGLQLIYVGIGAAILLALIQKRLKGIGEIANVVSVFADVLSYLRLYALALAASIMAETFNQQGLEIGLFVGVIVIILGHSVNLLLGTMGGVIHGLRLNFLEWYHYSFDGGGRLLNPLRRIKSNEIYVKEKR